MCPEAARWLQQAIRQLDSAAATLRAARDRKRRVAPADLIPALVALNAAVAMTQTAVWLRDHLPPLDPPSRPRQLPARSLLRDEAVGGGAV